MRGLGAEGDVSFQPRLYAGCDVLDKAEAYGRKMKEEAEHRCRSEVQSFRQDRCLQPLD